MPDAIGESAPLRFDIRQEQRATVVSVSGEIDIDTTPDLTDVLTDSLPETDMLVLDLTDVGFIDSIGLRALVDIHLKAAAADRAVRLVVGDGATRRPIEISGLNQVLSVYRDLDEALT
ncbi:STAS domain-containing protein [Actinocrispum sp. NPDC049592]|uniref:STAS domain-containing protein n=1 Tax=Actinocrispum sp. NPDC049592 TaxID=3154835 RepID=UPI003449159B